MSSIYSLVPCLKNQKNHSVSGTVMSGHPVINSGGNSIVISRAVIISNFDSELTDIAESGIGT